MAIITPKGSIDDQVEQAILLVAALDISGVPEVDALIAHARRLADDLQLVGMSTAGF